MRTVTATELRSRFAQRLAQLYGAEVPAYNTLVEVSRQVNADVIARRGAPAERLGDIERVTAERHCAIRVGSPHELAQLARIFAALGMQPVGFYDLRHSDGTGVPVVSTAFRPTGVQELALNPFRVFASMLAVDDARYFDRETREALHHFFQSRRLFSSELLTLADRAATDAGLRIDDAEDLLTRATDALRLARSPIDQAWYTHLSSISPVAADIGAVPTTHVNHLTPRVLDITELYERMQSRGIEMIDAIQGPPVWDGPDLLLRQTSFKALAERRSFRTTDGTIAPGDIRVRFGEVEQRGIALTARGMNAYTEAMATIDRDGAQLGSTDRAILARQVWMASFPASEAALARRGLAWFAYRATATDVPSRDVALSRLLADGLIVAEPIVYEDFLPRSAAGIFRSNLSSAGERDDSQDAAEYRIEVLESAIGSSIADPQALYRDQRSQSLRTAAEQLGCHIIDDLSADAIMATG